MVALNPWYLGKSCASIANVLYLVPLTRALYIQQQTPATTWLSITHDHSPLAFTKEPLWLLGSASASISEKRSWRFAPWWLWFCGSQQVLTVVPIYWDAVQPSTVKNLDFWRIQKVYIYIYAWNVCVYTILYHIRLYHIIIMSNIISYHISYISLKTPAEFSLCTFKTGFVRSFTRYDNDLLRDQRSRLTQHDLFERSQKSQGLLTSGFEENARDIPVSSLQGGLQPWRARKTATLIENELSAQNNTGKGKMQIWIMAIWAAKRRNEMEWTFVFRMKT